MITQEDLVAKFDYLDGWLVRRSTNEVCGTLEGRYVKLTIGGVKYYVHRLVFLWHHGYTPIGVDHIDRDGYNNRIENLREANQRQNLGNAGFGLMRGIEKRGKKFRVRVGPYYARVELGTYQTLEEAVVARNAGCSDYFGEFFTPEA